MKRTARRRTKAKGQDLLLKIFREEAPDDRKTGHQDSESDGQQLTAEEFWAGRNSAMRLSARVAA
jgi:hypothetical protein